MLSPEYLSLIEFNDVVELYNKLNIEITADIINRVSQMQDITETTKKQLEIIKQTNGLEIFNKALEETSMLTAETKKALKLLFEDMAKEDIEGYKELYEYRDKPFKLSESQYKILNQGLKDTNKLLKNFTKTIAFQSQQAYVEAVDSAYFKVASGAFNYATAIHTACQELANKGITLKDRLGRNVQLEVAVRRNVMTGIQQTANNINRDIEEYLGCDGYEVTAHLGARPSHAEAQGKQYAMAHNSKVSRNYPLWNEVESLWSEYNCRHSYFGIILGISEPVYTNKELKEFKNATVNWNGKKIPYYEATQKQRQFENAIRKQKRTVQTLEKANMDNKIEKGQLAQLQKKYKDFCKGTGLEKDYSRLQVAKMLTNNNNGASMNSVPNFKKALLRSQEKSYSEKEIKQIAKETSKIANKYTNNKSKWSGNINISNRKTNAKLWNCNIEVERVTSPHTMLHEHLHAHSISYYNREIYKKYKIIEEATVEFYTKEIGKKENIINVKSAYDDLVENLKKINNKLNIDKSNFDFAQRLFNMPVTLRLNFLENKVQNYLIGKQIDEAIELSKLMEVLYD